MMCEHKWITARAVYRESVVDGYKNHEINRRVCINCLKTQDEIDLENQLAAANARIAEHAAKCETCFDNYAKAIGKLTERAERSEAECRRLRVCGNCRHCSQGYSVDCCVEDCDHGEKETRRGNTCNDWEMI